MGGFKKGKIINKNKRKYWWLTEKEEKEYESGTLKFPIPETFDDKDTKRIPVKCKNSSCDVNLLITEDSVPFYKDNPMSGFCPSCYIKIYAIRDAFKFCYRCEHKLFLLFAQ